MEFLKSDRLVDPPAIDAVATQKISIAKRLVEVIQRRKDVQAEEKMLKAEVSKLFAIDEEIGDIKRTVQHPFKPMPELIAYLKGAGLWEAVTVIDRRIIKDRVSALAKDDSELADLYAESLKAQDRILCST